MKNERGKLWFWSTILIAWTITSCAFTDSEPKKLVITEPVVIECTGPVTYHVKWQPVRWTWLTWWQPYVDPWWQQPPVQPESQYYTSTVGGEVMMPRDTKQQIDLYVDRGVPVGSFLYAVLSNDLMETFLKADAHNKVSLQLICEYVQHFTPALCHGSPERVAKWKELHRTIPKSAYTLAGEDRERREAYYKPKPGDDDGNTKD